MTKRRTIPVGWSAVSSCAREAESANHCLVGATAPAASAAVATARFGHGPAGAGAAGRGAGGSAGAAAARCGPGPGVARGAGERAARAQLGGGGGHHPASLSAAGGAGAGFGVAGTQFLEHCAASLAGKFVHGHGCDLCVSVGFRPDVVSGYGCKPPPNALLIECANTPARGCLRPGAWLRLARRKRSRRPPRGVRISIIISGQGASCRRMRCACQARTFSSPTPARHAGQRPCPPPGASAQRSTTWQ